MHTLTIKIKKSSRLGRAIISLAHRCGVEPDALATGMFYAIARKNKTDSARVHDECSVARDNSAKCYQTHAQHKATAR